MEKFEYLKEYYYNCISIIAKNRTLDLYIKVPKELISIVYIISQLTNKITKTPIVKRYFVYQRIKMLLTEECQLKNISLNELVLIGLIKLAKH